MILQTRDKKAQNAHKAWLKRYENADNPRHVAITEKLNALTLPERTADRIDQIIGNDSWTRIQCDCCGTIVDKAICATELEGHTSLMICADCLTDANSIMPT